MIKIISETTLACHNIKKENDQNGVFKIFAFYVFFSIFIWPLKPPFLVVLFLYDTNDFFVGGGGAKNLKEHIQSLFIFIFLTFLRFRQTFHFGGGGGRPPPPLPWIRPCIKHSFFCFRQLI